MSADQREWTRARDELVRTIMDLGFPEELPEVNPLPEPVGLTPALEAMQAIYDKHRALFDAADNATPEEIKQAADYLEFLKSQR